MKKSFFALLLILLYKIGFSQQNNVGIEASLGTNFNAISSSYQIPQDYKTQQGIGLNLSGIFILKYS